MVSDLLIAAIITVIAVVLGLTVHPLLFLLIVFAILFLLLRRR
ncbi:MAG TPA: hypothetical protein VFN36_06305 [Solirubrobacteraceae bacterium]|nr:hypothetical protein [Solirubrobacteraceae bacterium]